ncbi:phosphotransferase enzyme family protein [Bacillus rubiinfantis]|uniref:phosphotransferase enzyme family protein n=1 Tax=Bacillus rubiinfantis TaxID=1499680 RepID=UPI0005A6FA5E|nr:phosphotransferase [Bacillus rubiinfantis]
MEKSVSRLFTRDILQKALHLFDAGENVPILLGDFENYAYEVYRNGIPFVLRFTHSSHRTKGQIEAELDWVNYLSIRKINVCRAFPSVNGKFVEAVAVEDSFFFVCLFKKANGHKVRKEDLNDELFYHWGKLVGIMHRATKSYQKPDSIEKRPEWDEEDLISVEKYIPATDYAVIEKAEALLGKIRQLEKSADSYGLIHSDVHSGNFFVEESTIELFDFDDCTYHWFASDIAIPIYYTVWSAMAFVMRDTKESFAENFALKFLKGYREENDLDPYWIRQIPLFLRLRDQTLYSVFHKKVDLSQADERIISLVADIKTRILNEEPIVSLDIDFILEKIYGQSSQHD